jgi:DNA repair protein RecO (recombination protein O)
LFRFTETCIRFLNDSEQDYVNLHLYFLLELSRYLGFEPQNNYSTERCYFDCREGLFSNYPLSFPLGLNATESGLFSRSLSQSLLQTRITNQERRILLDSILAYFKMHIPGFNDLKSLDVLRVLND